MSVIHGANYGTPTLDLNFAKNKSLIDTVSGRNLVTFSRAQANYLTTYVGADGLIKYASADEPRFDHNPLTGECLGLLIEESRGNSFSNSIFNTGIWNTTGGITTSNATTAPDGTNTAALVIPPNFSNTYSGWYPNQNFSFPGYSVLSFYAKANGYNWVGVKSPTGGAWRYAAAGYNLSTGEGFSYNYGSDRYDFISAQSVGNGWYRISILVTATFISGNGNMNINVYSNMPSQHIGPWTGDGVSGAYFWGAQLEAGSFPTSYIPTTGSTVTRSADQASITGTNFSRWYNQSEGTMFVNARMQFQPSVSGQFPDIYTTGSYPDRLWSLYLLNGLNNLVIGTDTHTQSLQTLSTSPQTFKVAQALSNTSLSWSGSKDGGSVFSGSLSKSITNTSLIYFGGSSGAVRQISRLTYYPTRLQNFQLQQLTK